MIQQAERPAFGKDALFYFVLEDVAAQDFFAATPAAGDIQRFTDQGILASCTCEAVEFSSGSDEPRNGDTLTGATSSQTCVFMFAVVKTGTWAGGTAAGTLFVKTVSGVLQAENLNNTTASLTNVLTIAGDSTAGLFSSIGSGLHACALTATEMQCSGGIILIEDQGTKAYKDQSIIFRTELDLPNKGVLAAASAAGGTLAGTAVADADYYNDSLIHIYHGTGNGQTERIKSYTSGRVFALYRNWPTTPDTASRYVIIPDAAVNVVGFEGLDASDGLGDAVWDEVMESSFTGREFMRLMASALFSEVSGAGVNAPVFRDVVDTKNRISATTDEDGNRLAVVLDPS